jgi:hypothetical protein
MRKFTLQLLYWVDDVVPLKRYWVGMQLEDAHRMINMGVSLRVKTAMKLMMRRSASVMPLIIKDVTEDEEAKEDEGLEEESGGDA